MACKVSCTHRMPRKMCRCRFLISAPNSFPSDSPCNILLRRVHIFNLLSRWVYSGFFVFIAVEQKVWDSYPEPKAFTVRIAISFRAHERKLGAFNILIGNVFIEKFDGLVKADRTEWFTGSPLLFLHRRWFALNCIRMSLTVGAIGRSRCVPPRRASSSGSIFLADPICARAQFDVN